MKAAKYAWYRAEASPSTAYSGPSSCASVGVSDYPDSDPFDDEQFAAEVEMYLTDYALNDNANFYKNTMVGSTHFTSMSSWYRESVAGLGILSLVDSGDIATMKSNIVSFVNTIIITLEGEGYPANINNKPISVQAVYLW